MAWIIRIDGNEVESDDFLVGDLAYVEKITDQMWSTMNPWRSADVAKAFIRVALVRSGISEEDADARVESLTLRDIKSAFDFKEDGAAQDPGGQMGKPRKGQTSRSSSDGEQSTTTGRRAKSGRKG